MVGGGQGAFIGAVHRIAAAMDGQIDIVCGAFSASAEKSVLSGKELHLPESRCYSDYQTMMEKEALLPADQRMDFVSIVTPNKTHFPIAKLAIEKGFHVMSDKPATFNLDEVLELQRCLKQHDVLYGLTHTYTGYPLIKQAKHLVENGELGDIVKVIVEYTQGWLAHKDDEESKQASWRLDPEQSGISCCMGDIGVHAANLAEYVTGLKIDRILCADLESVVSDRQLDDDGTVVIRFDNDAKGVLLSSQIQIGDENNLRLRVTGTQKSIEWSQLEPNTLLLKSHNGSIEQIRTGVGDFCPSAMQAMRTPAGHPEGYLEAFANLYVNFAQQIRAHQNNEPCSNVLFDVPGIEEAVRGMAFISYVVTASRLEKDRVPLVIPDYQ